MNWWNLEMSRLSAVNQTVIPGPGSGGAGLATRQNRIGARKVVPLPTSLLHLLNLLHCAHAASIITPVIPPPQTHLLVCLPGHKHNTFPLILPILSPFLHIYHLSSQSWLYFSWLPPSRFCPPAGRLWLAGAAAGEQAKRQGERGQ